MFGPGSGEGIWAVTGQPSSARGARLALAAQSGGGNGVAGVGDLTVAAKGTAANGVVVSPGGYVAAGQEEPQQGSYTEHMPAADASSLDGAFAANTTAATRYDLVCVRVEDPTVSGTPWSHDPAAEPVSYLRVITDVGADADDMPAGQTGVALARVEVPPNTSSPQITQAMVTDVRTLAAPRSLSDVRTVNLVSGDGTQTLGTAWQTFPSQADINGPVPPWANRLHVVATVAGLRAVTDDVWGQFRLSFAPASVDAAYGLNVAYNQGVSGATDTFTLAVSTPPGGIVVPESSRGTMRRILLEGLANTSAPGSVQANWGTVVAFSLTWAQAPE